MPRLEVYMDELERVTVRIRSGVAHPFAGREGSIPVSQWHPDVAPETEYLVRIKGHPATVKTARWMLDYQGPDGEWILSEMDVVLPQVVMPPSPDSSAVQEAVMQALGGQLGGGPGGPVIPTEGVEVQVHAPPGHHAGSDHGHPPAAHKTPRELADQIVRDHDNEVTITHGGVAITFQSSLSTTRALRALVTAVIEQARVDGAALASPGDAGMAVRLAELSALVTDMSLEADQDRETVREVVTGVNLVRDRGTREAAQILGRVNALEARCAELENKLKVALGGRS